MHYRIKQLASFCQKALKDVNHPNLPLFLSSDLKDEGYCGKLMLAFQIDAGFISLKDAITQGKLSLNDIGIVITQILNVTAFLHS